MSVKESMPIGDYLKESTRSNGMKNLSNSGIQVELVDLMGSSKMKNSSTLVERKKKYKIRVVRNDHNYENFCFFCKR